jgi:peptide/nickel transport system substrate-binding protein
VIPIEHGAHAPDIAPGAELVAQQLKKIGLKATVKQIDTNLWGQRTAANDIQATFIWDVQPMWAENTWTDYTPTNQWAPLWALWDTSGGKQGEEPPAAAKALIDIRSGRNQAVPYSDADKKLSADMYKNYADNVWIFPLAEKVNYALVVSQKLGNMPKSGQAIGADYSMEQFYFK